MDDKLQGITVPYASNGGTQQLNTADTGVSSGAPTPEPSNLPSTPISQPDPPQEKSHSFRRFLKRIGIALLALFLIGGLVLGFDSFRKQGQQEQDKNVANRFDNVQIPLSDLVNQEGIAFLGERSLVINGRLKANQGLVVAPSAQPSAPTAGQVYYDQGRNELGYYNGNQFVYVGQTEETVSSLGGATGDIVTGTGLTLVGTTISNSGVLSFQGQTGAVVLTAGPGIGIDGTTISNTGDPEVGNEVTDVVSGGGIARVGAGTTVDPYKVALQSCASGELLKSNGSGWECGFDAGGTNYTAGNGLQLVGSQFSINSPTCSGTDKLQWNGTAFICSVDQTSGYVAGSGISIVGNIISNTGALSVTASGALTSTGGQNPNIAFANGSAVGQFWQWDGDSWELATETDAIVGNEVTDARDASSGLTRTGAGTSLNPYKLSLATCANGEILKSSGSGNWACGVDNGGTYTAGNGLQLVGSQFSVNSPTCSGTDKLQWNGTAFVCSADIDTNTTYSAGTGLSLVGTTFNNTGVLSVIGGGPITSTGGQNPTLGFANGSIVGQYWAWDGDSWELTTIPADGDSVTGNEVTNATASGGLARAGAGTSLNPYTLGLMTCANGEILKSSGSGNWACAADSNGTAYTAGNGLQLVGTQFSVNSPTCSGTDKLQWTGTAFQCAADVDTNTTYTPLANGGLRLVGTQFAIGVCAAGEVMKAQATSGEWACAADSDTNTTYSADGQGIELSGTTFSLELDGTTLSKSASGLRLNLANANTWTALQTMGAGLTVTTGQNFTVNGDAFTDLTGTGLAISTGSLVNTGTLSVSGSGAITSTGGQNPTIAFANGSLAGQFWQWDGDSWELATLAAEGDAIVGNEVTDVISGTSGLRRTGTGTGVDPYKLGIMVCANGEVLKSSGSGNWGCAAPDTVGTTYTALTNGGLRLVGSAFGLKVCAAGELLQAQATSGEWECIAPSGVGTTYSAGTGLNLVGTTFNNTGTLSVSGSGPITSSGGQTPNITFANGSAIGQYWAWDGDSWELTTLAVDGDSVTGNEVTNATASGGLARSGAGTSVSPYTLGLMTCANGEILKSSGSGNWACASDSNGTTYTAGNGLQLVGAEFSVNSPTCSGTDKLQWNGTAFVCSADVDTNTTYTAMTNGGLRLVGTQFAIGVCANGEVMKAQATSGEWACATDTDTNTTYTADGQGIELSGTTFSLELNGTTLAKSASGLQLNLANANTWTALQTMGAGLTVTTGQTLTVNGDGFTDLTGTGLAISTGVLTNTGVLSVAGSGAITSTGGQNPTVAFANGTTAGEFWQWDGDSWELATLAAESDAVIGNEVTNVTGSNSGLVRSGAGTAVSPYTLAANVGNGLQITSNAINVNSPTCSGTDKLQWTGTAFQCAADVDTNTTYTADGQGIELSGTTFSLELNGTTLAKSASGLSLNLANANTWTALQTFGSGLTVTTGQTFTVNGDGFTDLTGSGLTIATGALTVSVGNGLQLSGGNVAINSPTCSGTDKLQWNGTAFVCSADVGVTATLQTAYDAGNTITTSNNRNLVFTMADTATDSNFLVNLQCDTSCSTNGRFAIQDDGVDVLTVSPGGTVLIKPVADSTSSFNIKSSLGNNLFTVDTQNTRIGIGLGVDVTPTLFGAGLEVKGAIRLSAGSTQADRYVTPQGSNIDTMINIVNYNPGAFSQLVAMGLPSTAHADSRGILLLDARSVAHQPTLAVLSPDENQVGGFSWDGSNAVFLTKTSSNDMALQANGLNIITLQNVSSAARLGVGNGTPGFALDVTGDANISTGSAYKINGVNICTASGCTPVAGSGNYIQNTTTVQNNANMAIMSAADASVSLLIKERATQSADLIKVTDNADTAFFRIDNFGSGHFAQKLNVTGATGIGLSADTNVALKIGSVPSEYGLQVLSSSGRSMTYDDDGLLALRAGSTQTANLFEIQDSSGTALSYFTGAGMLVVKGNGAGTAKIGGDCGSTYSAINLNGGAFDCTTYNFLSGTSDQNLYVNRPSGNGILFREGNASTNQIALVAGGGVTFQNTTNTQDGFRILNSSGANMFTVDTINNEVIIGEVTAGGGSNAAAKLLFGDDCAHSGSCVYIGEATPNDSDILLLHGANGIAFTTTYSPTVAFFMDNAGRFGLNNSSPSYILHVGSASITTGTSVARFQNAGGTCTVTPNTAGGITCTSDARLKKNVTAFDGALDVIRQIDVKQYHMVADSDTSQKQIGVIAQQLERVLPSLVMTDKEGVKSVSYAGLAPVLLQAIKEQQAQIEQLRKATWSGGLVANDATFNGFVSFNSGVRFASDATFDGKVKFNNDVTFADNTAGSVAIEAGKKVITVRFKRAHSAKPIVNITPEDFIVGTYRVKDVTSEEFTIELTQAQAAEVRFNWSAFVATNSQ